MKKLFTLALALMGFIGAANAATVADIAPLKHSYVLVCEDLGARPGKGNLFGDNHFLDVTGGSTATNKGSVDLSVADGVLVTEEIAAKYGEYGKHLNFLRLKKTQDVIAMSVTAKSKVIIFYQDNNKDDRYPVFAKDAGLSDRFADGVRSERSSGEEGMPAVNLRRIEWTATDDGVVYVGDNNGDMFMSYIIIEANEAPGTPTIKVGEQKFEDGLWFREVSVKANDYKMEGSDEGIPTIVTYTTDGSTPTATSPVYTEPIKCFKDMTVKFQAYQDWGVGADEGFICDGADNEANVNFLFDAPSIAAEGGNVTITSPYEGAINIYSLNGEEGIEGSSFTLSESATVSAYSKIVNGTYATFTTKSTTKDVYVLNPIKAKKLITVAGTAVVDEEATATSTTGTIYKIENGAITADKMDFFVKNLTFGTLANADEAKAQYQVPAGQEAYIQMSNTNITFFVAEGDSVNVKVICSKNSCKNIDAADAEDGSAVTDRMCYVNVSGTNYGGEDLKLNPDGNVIEFGLKGAEGGSFFTFQKYSGTGNILISSIEIAPAAAAPALADGTYFLQNVAAQKFFAAGHSWGTQAIVNNEGLDIIVAVTPEGKYQLDAQIRRDDTNHFVGSNLFVDSPAYDWTISKVADDIITLANDTAFVAVDENDNLVLIKEATEAAQWKIVTYEDRILALEGATEATPANATFAIKDANFGRCDSRVSFWTMEASNQNLSGGNNENNCAESWHSTFSLTQTIEGLPNGVYELTAQGFYRQDGEDTENLPYFFINDKKATFPAMTGTENSMSDASVSFTSGLYTIEPIKVVVTDGTITVGAKNEANLTIWCIWDNFQLKYYGPAAEPADPNNLVKNWDCSGDDASSFWVHEWRTMDTQTDGPANLVDGAAKVYVRSFAQAEAAGNATLKDGNKENVTLDNFADWDSQFFITWDEAKATAAGDKLQLKMKVKADKAQTIASQLHKAPGAYVHWYAVGDINVTTEWTDFVSAEVDVVAGNDPGWGKTAEGCWTIAFNLAKGEENTIYFDDMVVYVIKPTGITEMYRINPEDGVRYNLAGKRVDDSYKGIVIMNGKKMLQK